MPIVERDPWRMQYFEGVSCPEGVRIPTEDADSYAWYPEQRWVYNKLAVAESQGLPCGLHGMDPPTYPVFAKPIYNLKGMGTDGHVLRGPTDYERLVRAGHFWMPLLEGEHVSTDVAVVDGEARWWRHVLGAPLGEGLFDYWTILAEPRPDVERHCGAWLRRHLEGYTGMVNFETIGAKIIEVHLRFADQWPDLYGRGWLDALVRLYAEGVWDFDDSERREGYSVVLFGAHGVPYRHPDPGLAASLREDPRISSVQVTFHEDKAPELHAMPPGGFRLAIVNTWDLEAGRAARERLALGFWSAQELARPDAASSGASRRARSSR